MFGFVKIALAMVVILLIGISAVIALPDSPRRPSGGGAEWTFAPFAAIGGECAAPPGWSAVPAFSTRTPRFGLAPAEPICPLTTAIAYLHRDGGDAELFVFHGNAKELETVAAGVRRAFGEGASEYGHVETGDGSALEWETLLEPRGAEGITYFAATASLGDKALILEGGARTRDFRLDEFLAIARGVALPAR